MRARLAIAVSGQACVLREVVLRNKPAELLKASPKGTVPVLVLTDGTVVDESLDIMRWALGQHDPLNWLSGADAALPKITTCDVTFKRHLDRYKYPNRYGLANGLADRDQGADFLSQLQSDLCAQAFLHGNHFGMADAAIAPFVRQFAHTDPAWFASQAWPNLQQWLAAFETSALFANAMEKFTPWTPESPPALYPAASSNNL